MSIYRMFLGMPLCIDCLMIFSWLRHYCWLRFVPPRLLIDYILCISMESECRSLQRWGHSRFPLQLILILIITTIAVIIIIIIVLLFKLHFLNRSLKALSKDGQWQDIDTEMYHLIHEINWWNKNIIREKWSKLEKCFFKRLKSHFKAHNISLVPSG